MTADYKCGKPLCCGYFCGLPDGHEPMNCGEPWKPEPEAQARAHYLASSEHFRLDGCARIVNRAFAHLGFGCYLVGSALSRPDFRDVDVRYIMDDESYDALFKDGGDKNALWTLFSVAISDWMSLRADLRAPVDFQIQRMTDANRDHTGTRSALGIVTSYHGELPSTVLRKEARDG